jgi:hypothetical protein
MAGRQFNQFHYGFEKFPVTLYAISVGAGAGADMTLQYWNPNTKALATAPTGGWKGIKSVSYNAATGKYKIKLQDTYQRCLGIDAVAEAVDGSTAPTTPAFYKESESMAAADPYVAVVVTNAAGTATAPTTNCRFYWTITLSNSTAV